MYTIYMNVFRQHADTNGSIKMYEVSKELANYKMFQPCISYIALFANRLSKSENKSLAR